ncbi:hypothetical protein [Acaryochloris sp. IP29b_bin.137]|uniref:hypothetical protein n=1 Tax=Acaryochloris sp. IP29b_bin.137 TaxID=2969217 RepID=UPI00261772F2|nr:hypothetical protein [Acaryochloris sp. IP29b_bin.137]
MLKKLLLFVSMSAIAACQGGVQSTPERVIQKILDAAKTRELRQLSSLCAPQAETTANIICEISEAQPEQKEAFVHRFLTAEIRGNTEFSGYTATVEAVMQPHQQHSLRFDLIQENGA